MRSLALICQLERADVGKLYHTCQFEMKFKRIQRIAGLTSAVTGP